MAGTVERLQFLVTSDSAQARGDLGKLNQSASASMSGIGKLQEAFKLGAGIGVGTTAVEGVIGGLQKLGGFALSQFESAIGAASTLQQSAGAVKAVFGSAASEVEKFGATSAQSVGLSSAAFQQQSAVIGGLLQSLGQTKSESAKTSAQLIQVGADVAAAFGGTTADAVDRIAAAFRGEYDPIQRYIGSIKAAAVEQKAIEMGLAATTGELTAQAKAQATLQLILEGTTNTAGQFAREQDTLAGQQQRFTAELENARAELGTALLPAMTELVKIARDGVAQIGLLDDAFRLMASDAKTLAEYLPLVVSGLIGIGEVGKVSGDSIMFALQGAANVVPGLGSSLLYLQQKMEDARKQGEKNKEIGEAFSDIADSVHKGTASLEQFAPALAFLPPALRGAAYELFGLNDAEKTVTVSTKSLADRMADLEKASSGLLGSLIGADSAQSAFFKTLESGSSSAGSNAKKIERAYRSIEDAQRSLTDSQKELEESLIARFVVGLGATSDEITLGQIAERDSTRGLADAKRDLADAQSRLNKLREVDKAGLLDAEAAYIQAQRDFVDAEKSGDIVQLNRAKADLLRTEKALSEQRDPSLTGDLAQAEQDVAAAQDAVTTAEIDAKQSRKDLNDLINSGKEGSLNLAEANKQVEAAQRRVVDSERSLVDAQDALTESASGLGGSVKNVKTQFQEGLTAADKWLQKLITDKATPEEFSEAVAKIYGSLKNVADQAGETGNLDTYLSKISEIYTQIRNISGFGNFAPGGFSNDPANAFQSLPETKIVMNLNGREFGAAVVEGLLAYQSANGSVPIRVSG